MIIMKLQNNNFFKKWDKFIFKKKVNFNNTTFLWNSSFIWYNFEKSVNFSYANFRRGVSFSSCFFNSEVEFNSVKFLWFADFYKTKFFREANFRWVDFFWIGYFFFSLFDRSSIFSNVNFLKEANFENTYFNWEMDFDKTKFHWEFILNNIDINNKVLINFSHVDIEKKLLFNLSDLNNYKNLTLNLYWANINYFSSDHKELKDIKLNSESVINDKSLSRIEKSDALWVTKDDIDHAKRACYDIYIHEIRLMQDICKKLNIHQWDDEFYVRLMKAQMNIDSIVDWKKYIDKSDNEISVQEVKNNNETCEKKFKDKIETIIQKIKDNIQKWNWQENLSLFSSNLKIFLNWWWKNIWTYLIRKTLFDRSFWRGIRMGNIFLSTLVIILIFSLILYFLIPDQTFFDPKIAWWFFENVSSTFWEIWNKFIVCAWLSLSAFFSILPSYGDEVTPMWSALDIILTFESIIWLIWITVYVAMLSRKFMRM